MGVGQRCIVTQETIFILIIYCSPRNIIVKALYHQLKRIYIYVYILNELVY